MLYSFMDFDKCISHIHYYTIIQKIYTALKILCLPIPLFSTPPEVLATIVYCSYSLVFLRMSYN